MKEKALSLAARGFAVFPLQPNSKRPLPDSRGFKDATTNDFEIEAWWTEHPGANIGLYPDACRPRLLIVDVDIKKGGAETASRLTAEGLLVPTRQVITPSGGWHLYYALPDGSPPVASSVEKLGPGVDVRSHGGYVVAPGSIINGKEYVWIR